MSTTTQTVANGKRALAGKYLTFKLGNESYGIEVLKVREIIRHTEVFSMPQMPAHIRGVINLRGKIIPVLALRTRFGLEAVPDGDQTCIMVVEVNLTKAKSIPMGLLVDGVDEVINLSAEEIEHSPDFGEKGCADYIVGIATVKGGVKTLLNVDNIVCAEPDGRMALRPSARAASSSI